MYVCVHCIAFVYLCSVCVHTGSIKQSSPVHTTWSGSKRVFICQPDGGHLTYISLWSANEPLWAGGPLRTGQLLFKDRVCTILYFIVGRGGEGNGAGRQDTGWMSMADGTHCRRDQNRLHFSFFCECYSWVKYISWLYFQVKQLHNGISIASLYRCRFSTLCFNCLI